MGISFPYNLTNGTTADAAEVQANLDEIKNNFDQDTIEDASANAAEFQATKLPDTASLPISGREELKVLRYQLDAIIDKTNWSDTPDNTLKAYLDEDDFVSDSNTQAPTQQSAKAYMDARVVTNGNAHDHSGGDGAVIPQGGIGSAAVGQGELKTTTGAVSTGVDATLTLPGGDYGFYPQVKDNGTTDAVSVNIVGNVDITATYTALIAFSSVSATKYAQQRYFQASPPYKVGNKKWGHFLYMLTNGNGDIISSYEAEDPPYAYNGPSHHAKDSIERIQAVPHPFADYWDKDPAIDGLEIVLVDLRGHDTKKWKSDNAKQGKGILEDLGNINKKGKIVTPQELGIGNIQGFTDRVKIRKHN